MNQELYEPFFELLVSELRKAKVLVRGIWIADVANQNASGVLNEDLLGDQRTFSQHDRISATSSRNSRRY